MYFIFHRVLFSLTAHGGQASYLIKCTFTVMGNYVAMPTQDSDLTKSCYFTVANELIGVNYS